MTRFATLAVSVALVGIACSQVEEPSAPLVEEPGTPVVTTSDITVTEPVRQALPSAPGGAPLGLVPAADEELTYLSAQPGTYVDAETVHITNLRNGAERSAAFVNGGFDPVGIPAAVGDTLEIEIQMREGERRRIRVLVPFARPPIVVRTNPPKRKRDVPIVIALTVVFSEPMQPSTVSDETIQLWQDGWRVAGEVRLAAGSAFMVEYVPAAPLAPETEYRLLITQGVTDLSGAPLEEPVEVSFTTTSLAPLPTALTLSAGTIFTCSVGIDGTARCWGRNYLGQLGTGWVGDSPEPTPVAGGHTFASLSAGRAHACAITPDHRAFCWGDNAYGQLGTDTTEDACDEYPAPRPCQHTPLALSLGSPVASISPGQTHTCGLTTSGEAYCWGEDLGFLGTGTTDAHAWMSPTPQPVVGGLRFTELSAGRYFTCGLTEAGSAYCWGAITPSSGVGSAPTHVPFTADFAQLAAGHDHMCALSKAGEAYCWGSNERGALGTGDTVEFRTSPTPVAGGLTFTFLTAGGYHNCGITTSGEAYCWGWNLFHQLGTDAATETCRFFTWETPCSRVPVAVSGGLRFASLSASYAHTCGVTAADEAYCWGDGYGATPVRVVFPP